MGGKINLDHAMTGPKLFDYNIEDYVFVEALSKWFKCDDLSEAHRDYSSDFDVLTFETDQSTIFHKTFYSMPKDSKFYTIYNTFVKNEIQELFDEEIIYQRIPTFRAQVPNNLGVAEWHKDKQYNHSSKEVNIYLPLTDAYDTSTVWTETQEGLEDYAPLNATYGEYYVWNGANWNHGNKKNKTGKTRISIDFRIMPISKYKDNHRTSTSNSTKMTIGHYWSKLNKE
tara:strand:+ start:14422 stop:15102 length:681 start_codon:yes stop_codon:yes gene_type:complete